MHCLRETVANEGFLALYKGVGPRLTRVCLEVRRVHNARTSAAPPLTRPDVVRRWRSR